jgi:hypothetical protein
MFVLDEERQAVVLSALKRYLVSIRHEYDEAVEIGDPFATLLRKRRDIILDLIKGLEEEAEGRKS